MDTTAERSAAPQFDLAASMAASPFGSDLTGYPPGIVGVVSGDLGRYESFRRSMFDLARPAGSGMGGATSMNVARNRNRLAALLLASGQEWLFTLDDDLVLTRNCLMRLLKVMYEGDWDIVCAFTLRRDPPFDALCYLTDPTVPPYCDPWIPDGRGGQMEIAANGLGGVLIRDRVFKGLERPYFRLGQIESDELQEDTEFFRRARLAGLRTCVDLDTPLGHTSPFAIWPGHDPDGRPVVALAGGGGEVLSIDPREYRAPIVNPKLVGL